ncbi:MAG: ABC transporter permease [Sulfurimonas sp.]|uniref:ABC transporter permease n=1 Tax=Sulfurimonas sp. TaxID=2022749 RepID=UPI002605C00B|nr:ABC transporter permease [Sulfurimonas sp.]MDD5372974.1 ABC transporter permease [Sulfurimonas sp.]
MISLKALSKNPFKSLLIFSSITIAVMAIFLISSVSQGIIGMYSKMIKTDGDIIITQKGISDTFFSNVDIALMGEIDKLEHVSSSYAMIVGASPIGHIPIAGIYGTTANHFSHYKLSSGRYPRVGEVILGENLAKQFATKNINIGNKNFEISGIYSSDIGFEEGGVVMNVADAGTLFNRSASFILVSSNLPNEIDEIVKKISRMDSQIEAKTTQNFVKEYNQFKIIENSSIVISTLAFAMGLMGIASVMSMIVNSRKEEFGIMRALGKSRFFIIKNLFFETLVMSFSAYLFALFLSLGILALLPHIEMLQGYVNGTLSLSTAIYVLASTLFMALLGSLFPAWIASKTDPILLINQGCA